MWLVASLITAFCAIATRFFFQMTSTPHLSGPDASSIKELEEKMRQLELEILGKDAGANGPFTPISSLKKRLEDLKRFSENSNLARTSSTQISTKLPSIPLPNFDGNDFDSFCKELFRFMRLSNLAQADDQTKLDWLIQALSPKLRKILESILERTSEFDVVIVELDKVFQRWKIPFP